MHAEPMFFVPFHVPQQYSLYFFFNDTATTEIYTLSLHDALPISATWEPCSRLGHRWTTSSLGRDRKSTRLNSSHGSISYAVFCLKKKNEYKYHSSDVNERNYQIDEFLGCC